MTYFKKMVYLTLPTVIIVNIAVYIYALEIGNLMLWASIIGFAILLLCDYTIDNSKNKTNSDSNLLDDEEIFLDTKKINPIKNIINAHQNLKFFSMALIGAWGSGKSSYLKTLQEDLKQKHHIIYLNVWELEDSSNVISEVKKEFDNIIFNTNYKLWLLNTLQNIFYKDYFGLLSKYFIKSDIKLPSFFEQTLKESKDRYNELLKKILSDRKIIIMIDEVDRLHEKQEILNIFKVIRYTASFDNVFVITALDLEQVEKKLTDDIEYIHKIFNIKHHIPKATKNEFLKYYKEVVFEKSKDIIAPQKFENLLTSQDLRAQVSLLDLLPTFRVLKNSFNDSFFLISSLQSTHKEEWQSYITFEFVFIMNFLKASSYKDYHYLVPQNNIEEIFQLLKQNKSDKLKEKNLEKETLLLLHFLLQSSHEIFFELYLEIYKNYAILEYNISNTKYLSLVEVPTEIEKQLEKLYIKEDRTKYILDLIYHIYEDKTCQYDMLKIVLDLLVKHRISLNCKDVLELLVLRSSNVNTLVNPQNQDLFLVLLTEKDLADEFMSLIFENQKLMYFGKQIEDETVKFLLGKYLISLNKRNVTDEELSSILQNLFLDNLKLINIQNNDAELANDIRMMIYDEFKSTKKHLVAKFLIDSLFFEDISAFFEINSLDISSLIDESIYYKVIPRNGTVSSVDGKELKEKLTNAK